MTHNENNVGTGATLPAFSNQTQQVFMPDYKYANEADIANVTKEHLAKLEVELHTMRMMYVVNGENDEMMIAPGRKISDEMQKVTAAIGTIEAYFAEVLNPSNATV